MTMTAELSRKIGFAHEHGPIGRMLWTPAYFAFLDRAEQAGTEDAMSPTDRMVLEQSVREAGMRPAQKYREDQTRDEGGRFADEGGGGSGHVLYHGTDTENIETLRPNVRNTFDEDRLLGSNLVYLSSDESVARFYATGAAGNTGRSPVTYEVRTEDLRVLDLRKEGTTANYAALQRQVTTAAQAAGRDDVVGVLRGIDPRTEMGYYPPEEGGTSAYYSQLGSRLADALAPSTVPGRDLTEWGMDVLNSVMREAGYDGLKHIDPNGGVTFGIWNTDKLNSVARLPAEKTLSEAQKFREDQLRDDHGRFADEGGVEGGRLAGGAVNPTARQEANVERWLAKHGWTKEQLKNNLRDLYRSAGPQSRVEGMRWYHAANELALRLSGAYGVTTAQAIGVIAALSPQMDWDMNRAAAERVLATVTAERWELTKEDLDDRREKALSYIETKQSIVDKDASRAGVERWYADGLKLVGDYRTADVPTETLARYDSAKALFDNTAKAIEIARGGDADKILSGSKVRSFYDNILDPEGSREVTVDTHMIRALANDVTLPEKTAAGVFKSAGQYSALREIVRDVAAEEGITPNQLQAVAWVAWQEQHGMGERRAYTASGGKALDVFANAIEDDPDSWDEGYFEERFILEAILTGAIEEEARGMLRVREKALAEKWREDQLRNELGQFADEGGSDRPEGATLDPDTVYPGDGSIYPPVVINGVPHDAESRKAAEEYRFKGRAKSGLNPTDWPETKPWERSAEDFRQGLVPGFKYMPEDSMRPGGFLYASNYTAIDGTIHVQDAALRNEDPEGLRVLFMHEIGHDVAAVMLADGSGQAVMQPWDAGHGLLSDAPFGASDRIEEALSDAYLAVGMGEIFPEGEDAKAVERGEHYGLDKLRVYSEVAAVARELKLPISAEWEKRAANLTVRRGKAIAEKYSEDQLRDDHGRFADMGGGETSSALAGPATAAEPEARAGGRNRPDVPGTTRVQGGEPLGYFQRMERAYREQKDDLNANRMQEEATELRAKLLGGTYDNYTIWGTETDVFVSSASLMTDEQVGQSVAQIADLARTWPSPGPVTVLLGEPLEPGVFGQTMSSNDRGLGAMVIISRDILGSRDRLYAARYPDNDHARDASTLEYTIAHEWGHVLDTSDIHVAMKALLDVHVTSGSPYVQRIAENAVMANRAGDVIRASELKFSAARENNAEAFADYALSFREKTATGGKPEPASDRSYKVLEEIGFLDKSGNPIERRAKAREPLVTVTYIDGPNGGIRFVPSDYKPPELPDFDLVQKSWWRRWLRRDKFREDQLRDEGGRFADEGGGAGGARPLMPDGEPNPGEVFAPDRAFYGNDSPGVVDLKTQNGHAPEFLKDRVDTGLAEDLLKSGVIDFTRPEYAFRIQNAQLDEMKVNSNQPAEIERMYQKLLDVGYSERGLLSFVPDAVDLEHSSQPRGAIVYWALRNGLPGDPDRMAAFLKDEPIPERELQSIAYDTAREFVDSWARSASDTSEMSLAMQEAVAERFGTPRNEGYAKLVEATKIDPETARIAAAVVDSVYTRTQAYLKEHGITEVSVHRGMTLEIDSNLAWTDVTRMQALADEHLSGLSETVDYLNPRYGPDNALPSHAIEETHIFRGTTALEMNPVSSFSLESRIAKRFSDVYENKPGNSRAISVLIHTTVPASQVFSTPQTGPGCALEHEVLVIGKPTPAYVEAAYTAVLHAGSR